MALNVSTFDIEYFMACVFTKYNTFVWHVITLTSNTFSVSSVYFFIIFFLKWNSHGYDIAKIFASKFTHISPVWLQLVVRCVHAHKYNVNI